MKDLLTGVSNIINRRKNWTFVNILQYTGTCNCKLFPSSIIICCLYKQADKHACANIKVHHTV